MIAVKIGTTGWRRTETLDNDEVAFYGEYFYEPDGFKPAMVWDAALNNIRPRTAAETLVATKSRYIEANRAECSNRIYARYPAGRQLSALAGIYDAANVSAMHDWIAANIAAENTAADLIEAATTVAAVEAVTVAWPV